MQKVYNLLILDESGSMAAIQDSVVSGMKELLQQISAEAKDKDLQQWVNFYSFNGAGIKELLPLQQVEPGQKLELGAYEPDCATPLYDAIGHSVNRLRYVLEKERDYEVLVSIFTDGAENASTEFSRTAIAQIIKTLSGQGWTFVYRGADHDVEGTAKQLNISISKRFYANKMSFNLAMEDEIIERKKHYARMKNKGGEPPQNGSLN